MGRAILIIGAAALAVGVIVYSLIECARTDNSDMRGLRKGGWITVILLLPLVGALLWLFLGRPKGTAESSRPVRGRGPDDDPQFLRNLEERRRQQEKAEKLRRWEEELRRNGGPGADGGTGPEDRPEDRRGDRPDDGPSGSSSAGRSDGPTDGSPGNRPPRG